jgi:hypothetical protein
MPDFEAFHVTANKDASTRIVNVLKAAGIRLRETVWHEIGRPEFVIEVHPDDLSKAQAAFAKDLGPGRSIESAVGNKSLMDGLLASDPRCQALVAKSKAGPRKPFPTGE